MKLYTLYQLINQQNFQKIKAGSLRFLEVHPFNEQKTTWF